MRPDIALFGGRVVDPESGLDGVRNVAISGQRITAVTDEPIPDARRQLDVRGLVVGPGVVDLHSHTHSIAGHRLQALDGVTTALDLEAGLSPIDSGYRLAAAEGRPLNYGFSASWGLTRMATVGGRHIDGRFDTFLDNIGVEEWQRPASRAEVAVMLDRLAGDLDAGALGIGVLVGYAQGVEPDEYLEVAKLAAARKTTTFTHARDLVEDTPDVLVDGAREVVRTAIETGAHMHYCHINSTSRRHIDRVLELVQSAQEEGSRVSVEAYPYGSGMTGIGAAFLDPDRLSNWRLTPNSLVYAPTGERIANASRLAELRRIDPGGLAIVDFLDESDQEELGLLQRALSFPGSVIASDAMPIVWRNNRPGSTDWPMSADAVTHPRTAGTYAKSLRWLVREAEHMTLPEFFRRASLHPAELLSDFAPDMRRKGRIQPGCDADLVVFDMEVVSDQATYTASTRPSTGFRHVLVNGSPVVSDGDIVLDAFPGLPVRARS